MVFTLFIASKNFLKKHSESFRHNSIFLKLIPAKGKIFEKAAYKLLIYSYFDFGTEVDYFQQILPIHSEIIICNFFWQIKVAGEDTGHGGKNEPHFY